MKKFGKAISFLMAAAIAVSSLAVPVSAEWHQTESGKRYYTDKDGDICIGWYKINGEKYFFDDNGYMKTGWYKDDNGKYYYLRSDGRAACDCTLKIKGKTYSFDKNGVYVTEAAKETAKETTTYNKPTALKTKWGMSISKFKRLDGFDNFSASDDKSTYSEEMSLSGVNGYHGYTFEDKKLAFEFYLFDYSKDDLKTLKNHFTKAYKKDPKYSDGVYSWTNSTSEIIMMYDSETIMVIIGEKSKSEPAKNSKTVYVTKTGKRYHYDSSCNGGTYYASTLEDALSRGLTPCNKCVN